MNPFRLSVHTRSGPALRAMAAPEAEAPAASVPWRVARRTSGGLIEVEHRGEGPLYSVRFSLAGEGMLGLSLPRSVFPGERLRVLVRGSEAERAARASDAMLVLRWFESDGRELLWPIAL